VTGTAVLPRPLPDRPPAAAGVDAECDSAVHAVVMSAARHTAQQRHVDRDLDFPVCGCIGSHPSAEPEGNRRAIRLMSGSTSDPADGCDTLSEAPRRGAIHVDAPPPYNDTCALRFDELINSQD